MANTNKPRGLRPFKKSGQPSLSEYTIASAYGTTICQGDPVERTGTGRNIGLAAAANADNLGVFWGVKYVDAQGRQHFEPQWTASVTGTEITCLVIDDPNMEFEIQCDTLAEADEGQLVDWAAGTADTVNGVSGAYADLTTGTSTTGMALRIVELIQRVDNEYGAYAKAKVRFAEHIYSTTGVGV